MAQHGEAEVAELEAAGAVGIHVGGLDVQVQHPGAVQRRQARRHVAQHLRHRRLPQTLPRRRLQWRMNSHRGCAHPRGFDKLSEPRDNGSAGEIELVEEAALRSLRFDAATRAGGCTFHVFVTGGWPGRLAC